MRLSGQPGSPKNRIYFKAILSLFYITSLAIIIYLLIKGSSFYLTPFRDRPHADLYRILRPAGFWGHGFGVIGSFMMILMLSYTFRKRLKAWQNLGALSYWLDIHIYFGIIGPLLIVLHTAFKVQGLVAVSFWSMVAVAVSGIFGRYLYLQIPRNIQGDEIGIKELEESNRRYADELRRDYQLSDETIQRLENSDPFIVAQEAGAIRILMTILVHDALSPFRFRRRLKEHAELKNIPHEARKKIIRITHRKSLLTRRVMMLNEVQRLFHYWHVVHKPFAIIMYTIMVIHIAVSVMTGYKWIF